MRRRTTPCPHSGECGYIARILVNAATARILANAATNELRFRMATNNGQQRPVAGQISGIVLAFDLVAMILLALAISSTRPRIAALFADFGVQLPAASALLLSMPVAAIHLALVAIAAAQCGLEFLTARTTLRLRVHVAVALSLMLVWCVYVWSVFVPMMKLVEGLG
jgi:hypothetical protein